MTLYNLGKTCLKFASTSSFSTKVNPKTAIVMINMGGPDTTDKVHDYLLRIMTDRDMIQLPVMQDKLGAWIANRRTPEVQKKYEEIGGGSPITKWTKLQGKLLCEELDKVCPETAPHKSYIAFRYVDPFTETALEEIEKDGVERAILFSQYPQYSCATTGSSLNTIYKFYKKRTFPKNLKLSLIDRWPTNQFLVKTFADLIQKELKHFPENIRNDVVILFSAHSLPLKAVSRGDSYPSEVAATALAVMQELNYSNPHQVCWQSKVGPLPWLGPFTDEALKDFVKQGVKNFVMVPIAFVNEHIETLHEMDIEYCHDLAKEIGVEQIRRVPAPNDHPLFIKALADVVKPYLNGGKKLGKKFLMRCPHCVNTNCLHSKKWYANVCQ
nr:ferrochelatase, mitochondrial [Onthophagus taurus]